MTILEAHQHAANALQKALDLSRGEARTRARLLVDAVAGQSHAHLLRPENTFDSAKESRFIETLEQALRGRPLPYILGRWEFFGLEFSVAERVLIPRPETELLVEAALQRLQSTLAPRVADLGTGSGCIAISLAHIRPDASLIATDICADALELAAQNACAHGVEDRINFQLSAGDRWDAPLRAAMKAPQSTLDAILSNPPYIASAEIATLQREVRDWEPKSALDGGADGLEAYRDLALQMRPLLSASGFFAAELGAGRFPQVRAIFEAQGWQVEAPIADFAGIERVLVAHLS